MIPVRQGKKGLTAIANDTARPGFGIGKLISARLVRRIVTSHIGTNPETQRQMLDGPLDVELAPQGTLAERIRARGYGLGGVLTPTGVGTPVEQGKRTLEIDGRLSSWSCRCEQTSRSSMPDVRITSVTSRPR